MNVNWMQVVARIDEVENQARLLVRDPNTKATAVTEAFRDALADIGAIALREIYRAAPPRTAANPHYFECRDCRHVNEWTDGVEEGGNEPAEYWCQVCGSEERLSDIVEMPTPQCGLCSEELAARGLSDPGVCVARMAAA